MTNKLCVTFVILAFLHLACSIVGLKILRNVTEIVVGRKQKFTLNCTNDEPVKWIYPETEVTRLRYKKTSSWTDNGTYFNTLTIYPSHYLDTGYYTCQAENNTNNIDRIYVYISDEYNPFAVRPDTPTINATMYDKVRIPCKPTSPNIRTILQSFSGTEFHQVEKYDPKIGYVLSTYPITDAEDFICKTLENKKAVYFTVEVDPPYNDSSNPYIEVAKSNFNQTILGERTASLNCSVVASPDVGIKSLEWIFPGNVTKSMIVENREEIIHEKFIMYFRMLNMYNLTKSDEGNYTCKAIDGNFRTKTFTHLLRVKDQ